jgi:hypothetical protein
MWLKNLKKALILEEDDTLEALIEEMPQFTTLQEMGEASYLLMQTQMYLEKNKLEKGQILQQLKNTLDFLKSTQTDSPSSINLKF